MKRKVSRSGSKAKKNKVAQWVLLGAAGVFATYYVGVGVKHGTRMLLNKFFDVGVVSVDFKHIYAQSVRDELQKTIKHSLADENLMLFKFDNFYQKLKAACPVIKHVVWQHGKPDKGFLKVEGYEPECVVNQRHILLEGGELVGKRFFTEYDLAKLPQVTVARKCLKNSDSRKKLQAFVQKLPAHVLTHFDMSYHGDQHIVFEPKKQGAIKQEIVTKQTVSFGDKEQQRIDAIINDMLSKKNYPRRKNSKVVFDFRLDKQVLVKTFDGPRKRRKGK